MSAINNSNSSAIKEHDYSLQSLNHSQENMSNVPPSPLQSNHNDPDELLTDDNNNETATERDLKDFIKEHFNEIVHLKHPEKVLNDLLNNPSPKTDINTEEDLNDFTKNIFDDYINDNFEESSNIEALEPSIQNLNN